MKNLLFITWDGPRTSYMEGLFMSIFQKINEREKIQFHVMQFTWADESRTASIRKAAEKMGIHYTAEKIYHKPVAGIGSFLTVQSGTKKIKAYIREHGIDSFNDGNREKKNRRKGIRKCAFRIYNC